MSKRTTSGTSRTRRTSGTTPAAPAAATGKTGTTADGGKPAASMGDLVAPKGPAAPAAPAASQPAPDAAQAASQPAPEGDTPAPLPEPKCATAKVQRGRPHPSLLQVIATKGKHPGRAHRIRRWDRYEVGMSVLHCRMTEGLDHLDVLGYYVKHAGTDGRPLMTLRPMTEEERKAALARWDGEEAEAQPATTAAAS